MDSKTEQPASMTADRAREMLADIEAHDGNIMMADAFQLPEVLRLTIAQAEELEQLRSNDLEQAMRTLAAHGMELSVCPDDPEPWLVKTEALHDFDGTPTVAPKFVALGKTWQEAYNKARARIGRE